MKERGEGEGMTLLLIGAICLGIVVAMRLFWEYAPVLEKWLSRS